MNGLGDSNRQRLETLLDQLALGDQLSQSDDDYEYALVRSNRVLGAEVDTLLRNRIELRLRLAMHLAPAEALSYQAGNTVPRWRLIQAYLENAFQRPHA